MPAVTAASTPTSGLPTQLSAAPPEGTVLGQSATDLISFFGGTPVVQPTGNAFDPTTRGSAAGAVMTFASSQSPSSVANVTTAEKSITAQSGTGATLTPASGDFFLVNKPTTQAGLGIGNVRYSSAGVVGLTLTNFTATTITPTTSEIYGIVGLRGVETLTVVLTPAAVAANTIVEQLFTVPNIRTGAVTAVNKPTSQAGLDIANVRAAANDQIGISFVNVTSGVLTPTAGETYTIMQTNGIDAISNTLMLQTNSTLTPAVVATATTADVTITSANVLANDIVTGIQKPTLQAGLGIVSSRVSAASTLKATFVNPTAGTLTPTASEDYTWSLFRPAPAAAAVVYSAVLTPASVAPNTTAEQTFTVTGVVSGSAVLVNKPSAQVGLSIMGARVSTTNVIAINFCNATSATITPTAGETYLVANFQGLIDTTAGNALIQPAALTDTQQARLVNSLQSGLGPSGLNLFNFG